MEKTIHNEKIVSLPTLSTEIFIIPLEEEKYVIYAPLRRAAFIGNAKVVNFLADIQRGASRSIGFHNEALAEFLRQIEILDADPAEDPVTNFSGNPEQSSVTLFLTTACNLRCTYCYASAGDTPLKSMTLEVAKRGINFVARNAFNKGEEVFKIGYHGGGEPTANWKVLTDSFEYAKQKAREYGIGVNAYSATNGVLSERKIDWIIDNLNGCSLSFDGLPAVHDKHRVTTRGKGSSSIVMHTMRRFDKAGFPYGLRLTITKEQIPRISESVEFICSNFNPRRIQVEPAYQLGRWRDAASAETELFIEEFRRGNATARKYGKEIFFSAARLGLLTNHFCGVTQDTFALSPDGNVSACYEVFSESNEFSDMFFYGEPGEGDSNYIFNLPVLNNLRGQSVENRPFCQGCFAKWSCAGDCYHRSLTIDGKEEFSGSDRCHITRELTKDQILGKIEDSGGVFWHELPT